MEKSKLETSPMKEKRLQQYLTEEYGSFNDNRNVTISKHRLFINIFSSQIPIIQTEFKGFI